MGKPIKMRRLIVFLIIAFVYVGSGVGMAADVIDEKPSIEVSIISPNHIDVMNIDLKEDFRILEDGTKYALPQYEVQDGVGIVKTENETILDFVRV